MWTDVHRERVSLEAEEELKQEYNKISRYNVGKKAYLFLSRWAKRNKLISKKMWDLAKNKRAFSWDASLEDKTTNAADRHQLEKNQYWVNDIDSRVTIDDPQVDELCKQYLNWVI